MNTNQNNYNVSTVAALMNLICSLFLSIGPMLFIKGLFSGIKSSFSEDSIAFLVAGLIMIVAFFGLKYLANVINDKKLFKFWIQYLKENNLEGIISSDLSFAIEIFNQCPNIYCQKYIMKLNPQVKLLLDAKQNENSSDQTPSQPQNTPDRYATSTHSPMHQPATTVTQPNYCVCAKCGTRNANDSIFCYSCGTRIK